MIRHASGDAPGMSGRGTLRCLLLAVAAALGAWPAAASAAEAPRLFFGHTARGGLVEARAAAADGTFGYAVVEWSARCRRTGVRVEGRASFEGTAVRRSRREFSGISREVIEEAGRFDAYAEGAMTGRRHQVRGRPGLERWSGLVDVEVELRREDGSVAERCRMRPARWTARRESFGRARWTMHSAPSDFLGAGRPWDYGQDDGILAYGDRRELTFSVEDVRSAGSWTAELAAPENLPFAPGRRYAVNDDDQPRQPGPAGFMDVSAPYRGCGGDLSGFFVIDRARFARNGRMREVTVRFELHCLGDPGALTGTISFRATTR